MKTLHCRNLFCTFLCGTLWTGKRSIFPNGLEGLLKNVPDGHIVLMKRQGLDNQSRQKLVKVVIDHLIFQDNPNHKFPSVLQYAAEEIVHLFPSERIESYFVPYTKKTKNSVKILPRGKLYSRFINSRRALTTAKLEKPVVDEKLQWRVGPGQKYRFTQLKIIKHENEIEIIFTAAVNVLEILIEFIKGTNSELSLSEKEKTSYDSLLYSTGDSPQQILKDWIGSHRMRMMKMNTFESTLAYFNTFPALKQPCGYQLLIEDFNIKYPSAKDKQIHKIWPPIAAAVIEILKGKQSQVPNLNSVNSDQVLLSLQVLPWLFQPAVLRNKVKQRNYKVSRVDMAERFFLHVPLSADLDLRISDRMNKLKEFELSIQPFMVAVGPLEQIQAYFVIFDNQRYLFNDCLSTVDATFKIMCALDLSFPSECKGLWQLIDQLVYKVNEHVDPCASVVLSEIEQKFRK